MPITPPIMSKGRIEQLPKSGKDLSEYKNKAEIVAENTSQNIQFIRLLSKAKFDIFLLDKELRSKFNEEEMKIARQAYKAMYRTIVNLIIGVLDVVPVAGDIPSWAADALKVARAGIRWIKIKVKMMPKPIQETLDLTPDVSIASAVGSEALEIITLGFIPTHLLFEFRQQFKHDVPRMIAFLEKVVREKKALKHERKARGLQTSQPITEVKLLEEMEELDRTLNEVE